MTGSTTSLAVLAAVVELLMSSSDNPESSDSDAAPAFPFFDRFRLRAFFVAATAGVAVEVEAMIGGFGRRAEAISSSESLFELSESDEVETSDDL